MPITPAELAREAAGAVAAGAEAVHLHPSGAGGAASLAAGEVAAAVTAVRQACQPVSGNAELTRLALATWTAARR